MTGLRVVHVVCTDAFAGAERYVRSSALNLTAAGCTVSVVGGSETAMREPLENGGVEWLPGSTVFRALSSLRTIARPDVIITHMTQADLAGVIAARHLRAPVVSTRHFASRRGSSAISRWVAGWVARRITAQLAISEFVAANVEGPVTVVYTGVDSALTESAGSEPIVLMAQRLEAEKFTEVGLRAWARLIDREAWRLQIAGEGAQLNALIELSESLGISDSVDFLGFQNDMDTLLAHASIYVAPTPREGLGLAVIEAMAHGLPVVAARGGGHLESVGTVASPAMFDPGDDSEAAHQISRLMSDLDERHRYGRALQERQRTVFTVGNQTEGTLRFLTAVVRG